jgi:hypothetical protein
MPETPEPCCDNCPWRGWVEMGQTEGFGCTNPNSPWEDRVRAGNAGGQCPDHPQNIRDFKLQESTQ